MVSSVWFSLMLMSFGTAEKRRFGFVNKIVGGMPTSIANMPYLVNLRKNDLFICGGALVTPTCVLTAAHCVYGTPSSTLRVHAGASKLTEIAPVQRAVSQYFLSTYFTMEKLDMDVAILRLNQAIVNDGQVATIELCKAAPPENSYIKISGWGVTREDSNQPVDQVRTTNVRIVPRRECQRSYFNKAILTTTMFCASIPGEKDSCSGDSGGPVVYDGKVCGIVSWGFGCARSSYPGVYTNVASLRVSQFINQTMNDHCKA